MRVDILVFLVISLNGCTGLLRDALNTKVVNKDVVRSVDISSQLIKTKTQIVLQNTDSSSINFFHVVIEPHLSEKLSFIDVNVKSEANSRQQLTARAVAIPNHGSKSFYRVQLRDSVSPNQTVTVELETVFVNALRPYPSHITQLEKQLIMYEGTPYFYTPYYTTKQITTFTLASTNVEDYTKLKPVSLSGSSLTYGVYRNVDGFDSTSITIHYENNSPFLSVANLERVIEVSHWGNIAIEEKINIKHIGAMLKGPFSRFDFQRGQTFENIPAVKSFKTVLPASAADVYYRDEIGNISTSHMIALEDSVELDIRPRFPLFGGWQTHYTLGYNVPSFQYLYSNGNSYLLQMRMIDHIFDDSFVEDLQLRIILPEGSKNVRFNSPYHVEQGAPKLHFTYLDAVGRPVITIHKSKLVEYHIQDFSLRYDFSKVLLLREPFLVVGSLYLLFLLVIIYVRLDFSVIKDKADETRQKVAGIVEQVHYLQEKRERLYDDYDNAVSKYKTSKNKNAFEPTCRKLDADYKKIHSEIDNIIEKLVTAKADSTVLQQVQDMQRKENERKNLLDQSIAVTERVVTGKLDRDRYIENVQNNVARRSKLAEDIAILASNL